MSTLTLSFKGKVLKVYPSLDGSMTLGSDPRCEIHIDSLALSPQHTQIDTHHNQTSIRDLNTEQGTFVGNTKVTDTQTLKDGDVIRVGKHTLKYTYSEDAPVTKNNASGNLSETAAPRMQEQEVEQEKTQGWLQIMNGANLGKTMSLNKSMTNLGKPGISTAVITKRQEGYFISQLEGEHPLLIKDKALGEKSMQLIDGDTIQIGNIKMQFYLE